MKEREGGGGDEKQRVENRPRPRRREGGAPAGSPYRLPRPLLSLPSLPPSRSPARPLRPALLPAPLPPPQGWMEFFPWTGASSRAGAGRGRRGAVAVVEARPDWAGRWGGAGAGPPGEGAGPPGSQAGKQALQGRRPRPEGVGEEGRRMAGTPGGGRGRRAAEAGRGWRAGGGGGGGSGARLGWPEGLPPRPFPDPLGAVEP